MPQTRPSTSLEFCLVRDLRAAPSLVFRMFAESDHMSAWSCPHGFTVVAGTGEFRSGGTWSIHMRSTNGTDLRVGGTYLEVIPDQLIVFTHAWLDDAGKPGHETLVTVTLDYNGHGTRLTFRQSGFDSIESRDGHAGGWSECLDKLESHLRTVTVRAA